MTTLHAMLIVLIVWLTMILWPTIKVMIVA